MRLRNRFRKEGFDFDHYEEHNILEFILCYCIPRIDTNELAHDLIRHFGSLSGVFDAPYEELFKVKGIGENAAVFLKMLTPTFRAYEQSRCNNEVRLNSVEKAKEFFIPRFIGRTEEFVTGQYCGKSGDRQKDIIFFLIFSDCAQIYAAVFVNDE